MGMILLQPASAKSAPKVPTVLEEGFRTPIILSSRHRPSGIRQTNACQLQMMVLWEGRRRWAVGAPLPSRVGVKGEEEKLTDTIASPRHWYLSKLPVTRRFFRFP